ncbi:MAG: ATP-grasp domain-containing protein [Cyclobacteriaceae bacterium]
MSKNNLPVALVLGGTFPHKRLVDLLKGRGFKVVLVDYTEEPPAKENCDEHLQKSTLDQDIVLKLARLYSASLVISACIDQANVTACYVLEQLELYAPYSYQTSLNVSDKVLMKRIMLEHDIPTSKFVTLTAHEKTNLKDLTFPVVVKPSDSNSSKGVRKANNLNETNEYLKSAFKISRGKKAVVEEFVTGREIGLDFYISNDEAHLIMSRERRKIDNSRDTIQQIYGSFWPATLSRDVQKRLVEVAVQIAKAFHLKNTPLLIQAIYNDTTGEINVLEFAPRIGGGDNYQIIELATGFDIINAAIDSFLGREVKPEFNEPKFMLADNYLYVEPCRFGHVKNWQELIDNGTIEYMKIYKTKGVELGEDISSNNRVGVFTVKGKTQDELLEKLEKANKYLEIFDLNGTPVMRKDIY